MKSYLKQCIVTVYINALMHSYNSMHIHTFLIQLKQNSIDPASMTDFRLNIVCCVRECLVGVPLIKDHTNLKKGSSS